MPNLAELVVTARRRTGSKCCSMVSGMVRRLVEIEAGSNATESQFFIDMERHTSLQISVAFTLAVAAVAFCGLRRS